MITFKKHIYSQSEAITALETATDLLEQVKEFCDMSEYDHLDNINYSYSNASEDLYDIIKKLDELHGTIENAEEPDDPERLYM